MYELGCSNELLQILFDLSTFGLYIILTKVFMIVITRRATHFTGWAVNTRIRLFLFYFAEKTVHIYIIYITPRVLIVGDLNVLGFFCSSFTLSLSFVFSVFLLLFYVNHLRQPHTALSYINVWILLPPLCRLIPLPPYPQSLPYPPLLPPPPLRFSLPHSWPPWPHTSPPSSRSPCHNWSSPPPWRPPWSMLPGNSNNSSSNNKQPPPSRPTSTSNTPTCRPVCRPKSRQEARSHHKITWHIRWPPPRRTICWNGTINSHRTSTHLAYSRLLLFSGYNVLVSLWVFCALDEKTKQRCTCLKKRNIVYKQLCTDDVYTFSQPSRGVFCLCVCSFTIYI